jgi:hypothetical protein
VTRVMIFGDGAIKGVSRKVYVDALTMMGVEVIEVPDAGEITGTSPSFVIGDDPCARELEPVRPKFGNPHPYLKRKKGRL